METVMYIIAGIAGIVIGGAGAWFIASSLQQKKYAEQTAGIQASYSHQITDLEKRASGAEARVEELRQQGQQRDAELNQTRNELNAERSVKARLEESQKSSQGRDTAF